MFNLFPLLAEAANAETTRPLVEVATRDYVIPWGIKLVFALLIFLVGLWVSKIIVKIADKMMGRTRLDPMLVRFFSSILKSLLFLVVIIAALQKLGIPTTSLVALVGAAGLAIGLALQGSLQNFASGVLLITFRPFNTGHFVEAGGTTGIVEEITLFHTKMRSLDNKAIIVPNGEIYSNTITNYSAKDTRRVDMVFGIGYDDDLRQAKQILQELIDNDERVLKDPEPFLAVGELADSSVNFLVRPWVNASDYFSFKCDFTERVKLAFDEAGISIPYPQMDIHLDKSE